MNWEEKTNDEIRYAQIKMNEEYEAIKLEIAKLLAKLDKMDMEYLKSKKILESRLKY